MSLRVRFLNRAEVVDLVFQSGQFDINTHAIRMLFGGERRTCIDEGAVFDLDGDIIGLATIAPEGEMHEGQPTIVGWYVRHQHRGQNWGSQILGAAIGRMRERGLTPPYKIDVTSAVGMRALARLDADLKQHLEINDLSMGGALDPLMLA